MNTTRSSLARVDGNVTESMGYREAQTLPRLSPVANLKDRSRRPSPGYGTIDVDDIVPDPDQPRTQFTAEGIQHLAASIKERGQLAPVQIRWSEQLEKWVIISGERRWRATKEAGLEKMTCYFHEGELTRTQILEQQLIENLLREDLQPIEEAKGFSQLMKLNGWNGKQVAEALSIPASTVSRALALLKLPNDIQERVNSGEVAARSGYELSKLSNPAQQRQLAEKAASGELTHDQTKRAVRTRKGKASNKPRGTSLKFLTEEGWQVSVNHQKRLTYYDVELALQHVLEEVQHRIKNNIQIF